MKKKSILGVICCLLLQGCRLGPTYEVPATPVPEEWKSPQSKCDVPSFDLCWWKIFGDCVLNQLEEQAIQNSPTLWAAVEKVVQARAAAGVTGANLYPQLNLNPSFSDLGTLFKIYLPTNSASPLSNIPATYRVHEFQYTFPLNMSYEIDFWGQIRSEYEAAVYNAEAQEKAFCTAILTLTSDLASAYFQLRTLDAQIDQFKETLDVDIKALNINQSRYNKGLTGYIDVSSAQLEVSNVEAQYYDAVRLRNLQVNLIAMLIGVPASEFTLDHMPLKDIPPSVPAGLPSTVLLRRPDIAEAERTVASENALIGSAYAAFFPTLTLTGTLGYVSPDYKDFMKWISRFWSLGVNAGQPVFDGGRDYENLIEAWANFREASANYQQVVLTAFQEVEDALNNLELQARESKSLDESVKAATKTVELSDNRYSRGLTNFLEVVVYKRSELNAKNSSIDNLGARYQSTIQLIKALGGGWGDHVDELIVN